MRALSRFLSNWLWIYLNIRQYNSFLQALECVEEVQHQYLMDLLRWNARTAYGMKYSFNSICSVREYQLAVPLTDYEHYLPYIEDIAEGKKKVLTHEQVLLFEPSSGTSSASKLVPCTRSLKLDFQRGIAPWIVSLFRRKPELLRGSAYWSISPSDTRGQYQGKIPVGFDEDAEYLGSVGKWLHRQVAAVPHEVNQVTDINAFQRQTLLHLLSDESLALISIWSPTFLTLLLIQLLNNQDEILWLLEKSELTGGVKRAKLVRAIMQREQGDNIFEHIWPKLSVISCWTHGSSEIYAEEIRKYFTKVEIQGKGLVATEAFVSLPLLPDYDPVLAVKSHFFEFYDNESGNVYLAHEVEKGKVYSVIITTNGGLYRYRLGDLVEVTGFIGKVPTLRFIGREGVVSDLFGEKLNSQHVYQSLTAAFSTLPIKPAFFLLAPVTNQESRPAYALFLSFEEEMQIQPELLAGDIEKRLCENYHYAYCRSLGQLGPLRLFLIDHNRILPINVFTLEMRRRGVNLGNIKPLALDREGGWEFRFQGHFIDVLE